MATMKQRIVELLRQKVGLSDREITDTLIAKGASQQSINQICRDLEKQGIVVRSKVNGRIKNYLAGNQVTSTIDPQETNETTEKVLFLSEDSLKKHLEKWLTLNGWKVQVAWGHAQGIDICATQGDKKWMIEVKGEGSRQPMRVNYFLGVLSETLQRMDDPLAEYSIALPDLQQFRNLWKRLPNLAKSRTGITILFIDRDGNVTHIEQ